MSDRTSLKEALSAVGRAALHAGVYTGRAVATQARKVDPDVARHLAHLPLLSYSLFVSRTEVIEAGTPDGHPPIIMVHGLGGNPGTFIPMASYLWLKGRKRSYKIGFEPGQSIHEMARALTQFVGDVTAATGEAQVEIVAHSLGGIISRLAMAELGLTPSVKTLITLGTPHHGTYSARLASTALTRDLRPGSELLTRLAQQPWPEEVRGVSFYSHADIFVLPPESAALDGTEQVDATPFTHYSYLIGPRAWIAVGQVLAGFRPVLREVSGITT